MESTNSKTTVLLARLSNGHGDQQNSQALRRHRRDDICHGRERSKILRHDKGLKPNRDARFATEGRSYLLSIGFVNWSPHLDVDPQPFIEAGYWGEHNKLCAGLIHAGYKNEAILGYAYDFNERWRLQVDFQSGSENSSTIGFTCNVTPDFQFNPALYVSNGPNHDLFGYVVFTYTFHVWGKKDTEAPAKRTDRVAGAK
jgi:hypothetical protein